MTQEQKEQMALCAIISAMNKGLIGWENGGWRCDALDMQEYQAMRAPQGNPAKAKWKLKYAMPAALHGRLQEQDFDGMQTRRWRIEKRINDLHDLLVAQPQSPDAPLWRQTIKDLRKEWASLEFDKNLELMSWLKKQENMGWLKQFELADKDSNTL